MFISGQSLQIAALVCIHIRIYLFYKLIGQLDLAHRKHCDRSLDSRGDALLCKYLSRHSERSWTNFHSSGHPQLTRRRNADKGPWCGHALVKIVRLTIETNMMTSLYALSSRYSNHLTSFQPLLVSSHCWSSQYYRWVNLNVSRSAAYLVPGALMTIAQVVLHLPVGLNSALPLAANLINIS
jgi:hypothetical protein